MEPYPVQPQAISWKLTRRVRRQAAGFKFWLCSTRCPTISCRWQKEGMDNPAANATTYATPPVATGDNGKKFRCVVGYPGLPSQTTSEATLTINIAYGAIATSNRPLWNGFSIIQLVDGNRQNLFHLS